MMGMRYTICQQATNRFRPSELTKYHPRCPLTTPSIMLPVNLQWKVVFDTYYTNKFLIRIFSKTHYQFLEHTKVLCERGYQQILHPRIVYNYASAALNYSRHARLHQGPAAIYGTQKVMVPHRLGKDTSKLVVWREKIEIQF